MKNFLLILCLSILAGCGFEPLYAQKKNDSGWYFGGDFDTSITQEMAQVKIEYIKDRFGQQIRNNLLDNMTPKGSSGSPQYKLVVVTEEPQVVLQALREDITATRERARYLVKYMMYDNAGNELLNNNSIAYVSYDILANPYSTTMASKKAQENAAKIIADDITLRVGAYFHSKLSK